MAIIDIKRTTSLTALVSTEHLVGNLYVGENVAHRFTISAERNGRPEDLSGTITAQFIRTVSNDTILISGSIVDGSAVVTLPQTCYNETTTYGLVVFLTQGSAKTVIYSAAGFVKNTQDGDVLDPGGIVPDITDVLAALEQVKAATEAANRAAQAVGSLTADSVGAVSYTDAQTMSEAEKAQARTNIGAASAADISSSDPDASGAVAFSKVQNLTDAQKSQARSNIGLGDIGSMVTGTVKYSESQTLSEAEKLQARTNVGAADSGLATRVSTTETAISELQAALSNASDAVTDVTKTSTGIRIAYTNGTTKDIAIESGTGGLAIVSMEWDDNHYFHLYDKNGEDLVDPVLIEGGSGGGGTTAGSASIARITPAETSFLYGTEAAVEYTFTATDAEGDTVGAGTGTWYVGGIAVATGVTVNQGDGSFDLSPYLAPGANEIRFVVLVDTGGTTNTRAVKTWTITAVNMYFVWGYTDSQINQSAVLDSWTVFGDIEKTTHTKLDGVELANPPKTTRSNYAQSMTIPMQSHGAHGVERWLSATLDNTEHKTDSQYHEMIFAEQGNTTPIIAISMQSQTVRQYDTVRIPVTIYSPASLTSDAELLVDDIKAGEWNAIDRTVHYWNYTPSDAGTHVLTVKCGEATRSITITATAVSLDAEEQTGYTFRFKASEMATNAAVQAWSSNGINASFSSGFDWINGGLKTELDDNGNLRQYMCIKAGDRMTINCAPFATDPRAAGMTFKIIFRALRCRDYDAKILTCLAQNVGIELSAHKGQIQSTGTSTSMQYAEGDYIELEFDISPLATTPITFKNDEGVEQTIYFQYLMGWMDGVMSTCVTYATGETFAQTEGNQKPIVIGSDDCDVYLYLCKLYPKQSTIEQHIQNFIMDAGNATEMMARYNRNNILNTSSEIDYQRLMEACPDLRIWLYDIPYLTNGKSDKVKGCAFHQRWKAGGQAYQLDGVGTMSIQGTSSVNYIKGAANTDINLGSLTDGDGNDLMAGAMIDEDGYGKNAFYSEDGSTITVYEAEDGEALGPECVAIERYPSRAPKKYIKAVGLKVSDSSCPITYSNTKVNFASCEQVNNMCNAIWYERFQPYPSLTNRDCMEFSMGVQFIRESGVLPDDKHFRLFADTNYHMYSIANMGTSKKDVHIFHDLANPLECCIEVLENGSARQRMISDDLSEETWDGKHDFEMRYPDTKNPSQAIRNGWQRLLTWMATRNPLAYTGETLATPETYGPYTFKGHDRSIPTSQGDHNWAQVLRGTTVKEYAGTYTKDTFERRMARMLSECEDYLVMDSLVYHFLFVERHTAVDNVTKNTFWSSTDCIHWDLSKSYDMDTSDGNNNLSYMVFDYGNEMDDVYQGNVTVFNGANSVWFQFVGHLFEACQTMYLNRESLGTWSAAQYTAYFKREQAKIPERVWNECYRYGYIRPFEQGIQQGWLRFLAEGQKLHQRQHFEYFQERYIAAKYQGSANTSDAIYLRTETPTVWGGVEPKEECSIKMYNKMYINVFAGGYIKSQKVERGVLTKVDFSDVLDGFANTTYNIYGASMIQEIQGLAQMYPSMATLGSGSRLRVIEIGSAAEGYQNSGLVELSLQGNTLLEKLEAQNLTAAAISLDLSSCPSLLYLDARGSAFTGYEFAAGGLLEEAYINAPRSIRAQDLAYLTDAKLAITTKTGLQSLWIENTKIDVKSLVEAASGLTATRLIGISGWNLSDATLLERLYNINGLNEDGLATYNHAVLTGSVYVGTISRRQLDKYEAAWAPGLTITYGYMPDEWAVSFYNLDGNAILDASGEPYVQYITQGETPYNPSEDGIADPTMPDDDKYSYTFTGWPDLTVPVYQDKKLTAQYTTEDVLYTVRYWDERGGNILKQVDNVHWGDEIVFSSDGTLPTLTKYESSYIFNVFLGWNKSTGCIIKGDGGTRVLDVYAQWSRASNYPSADIRLNEMTPGQIYALTRYLYSFSSESDRAAAATEMGLVNADYFDYTLGRDFDFDNVDSDVLISEPTYFDGNTIIKTAIKPFSEGKAFTIAIDFEYCATDTGNVLANIGCLNGDTQRGILLQYSNGPDIQYGDTHALVGATCRRGIVVIRYRPDLGTQYGNIFVYANDVGSETIYADQMTKVELTRKSSPISDNVIAFGGIPNSTGDGGINKAKGWIHWAKIWYADLGPADCSAMGNWPHEKVRMEYYGPNQYYHGDDSTELTAMSFISNGITPKGHAHHTGKNTNEGGWPASELPGFLDGRYREALPAWVKALIKKVRVYSSEGLKSTGLVYRDGYIYAPSYREVANVSTSPYGGEARGIVTWFAQGQRNGLTYSANAARAKWRGQLIRKDAQIITSASDPTALTSDNIKEIQEGDIWVNTSNGSYVYMYFSKETYEKHRFIGQDAHPATATTNVIEAAKGGGVWLIANGWWERSPYASNETGFMNVGNTGGAGYGSNASNTNALCPSFSF